MKKIVIKTWRGLVSEVYADTADVEVIVVDEEDDDEIDAAALPEHRVL